MFTLRPHHLKPLRKYQRGNIVVGVGLPPTLLPPITGGPGGGWTLDEVYDTALGDMVSIEAAFGETPRADSLAWSPDGSKLTLASSGTDQIKVFQCNTPFNPNTAVEIATFNVVNPGQGRYNTAGTQYMNIVVVGDEIQVYPASGFVITSVVPSSNITKGEVSFNSSTDGPMMPANSFEYLIWSGRNNTLGDAFANLTTPGGDLDNFVDLGNFYDGGIDPDSRNFSNWDKDETLTIQLLGSSGIRFLTFDSPRETSSYAYGPDQATSGFARYLRPESAWFDPLDTRFVWMCDRPSGEFELFKYATNVPVF